MCEQKLFGYGVGSEILGLLLCIAVGGLTSFAMLLFDYYLYPKASRSNWSLMLICGWRLMPELAGGLVVRPCVQEILCS